MRKLVACTLAFSFFSAQLQGQDVGVTKINAPLTGCNLGNETVTIEVSNFGNDLLLANIPLYYQLDSGVVVTQNQLFPTFGAGSTQTVTFGTTLNLSGRYGKHMLKVYSSFASDTKRSNDTISIILYNYAPSLGGELLADDTVCANANGGGLVLTQKNGDVVQWERNADSVWYPLPNADTFYHYSNLTKTTSYRVLVKNGTCAGTYSDTATITTYLPQIKITPLGNIRFCKGDSVVLMASPGYTNYQWSNGQLTQNIKVFQEGQYKVTVADSHNCQNSDSIQITVYPLPIANAGMDATISLGASVLLKGRGGVKYLWQPGETLNDSTISEPLASPLSTTTYRLLVTDSNQCSDTDEVKLTVVMDYNIYANNIITPNGDGVNDTWKIKNILPYEKSTVTIVNRYGYIVYEKTGYDNSWNGTVDGERVSDGTYYYIVTFDDNAKIVKGHVTVLSK